jgi:hypothetical protein
MDSTERDEAGGAKFQDTVKNPGFHGHASETGASLEHDLFGKPVPTFPDHALEIDSEYQPRLMALEINEIEACVRSNWSPPHLCAPGRGQA